MTKRRTVSNIKKATISILLIIISLFSIFITPFTAYASTVQGYTSALDDLKKDLNFDVNNYPSNPESNEIQIIHIGEGVEGELYIYTYQPGNETKHYKAKFINMSLQSGTDKNATYELYSLTWINSDGVFDKYIVNDFTITEDVYRYYTVASIYRLYDESVDASSSSEAVDTLQCRAFPVGQTWCLYYYNGILIYEMATVEYVDITMWATGSIAYSNGFKLYDSECDSHYVAFSVDNFNVDKVYDADITYTVVDHSVTLIYATGTSHFQTLGTETVSKTLTEYDTGSNTGDGLFGKKYTWDRICTVDKFRQDVAADTNEHDSFSAEESEALDNAQFVFRFAETDYESSIGLGSQVTKYSTITNIGILRLHFLADGKVYNLGVVGDLVGTDADSEASIDNIDNILNNIEEQEWWQKIIAILLLILLFVFITPVMSILSPIFKIVFKAIGVCLGVVFNILTFPLRLIFKSKRE